MTTLNQQSMNDQDILTALSFLKVDDRKLIEKIIQLLIIGKRVSLVMEDVKETQY